MPPIINNMRSLGANLVISSSSGKDSQAMQYHLTQAGALFANVTSVVHADLGRAEWFQTPAHMRWLTYNHCLPLHVVKRPQGDLVQQIQDRMEKLQGTGKPFWPSSAARYCTSDQKRAQIDKHLRQYKLVICAIGIRSDESPFRASLNPITIRKRITSKRLRYMEPAQALEEWRPDKNERLALDWYPIFDWNEDQVWRRIGYSLEEVNNRREWLKEGYTHAAYHRWYAHPAYILGNHRLSCALCILANKNDLANGAKHNPKLLKTYLKMEREGGFSFKHNWSLSDFLDEDDLEIAQENEYWRQTEFALA